jgi:hypothetical protein
LFDANFLPVHTLRKILIPHNTMTIADTSVATANTLSKEATRALARERGSSVNDATNCPKLDRIIRRAASPIGTIDWRNS